MSVAFKIAPFFSDYSSAIDSSFQIFNNISMNSAPPDATIQGSTTVCQNDTLVQWGLQLVVLCLKN